MAVVAVSPQLYWCYYFAYAWVVVASVVAWVVVASVVAFVVDAWEVAAAWAGHIPCQAGHTEVGPALVQVVENHFFFRRNQVQT